MNWKQFFIGGIAVAVIAAAGAAGGWVVQGWRKDADIADLKREQADDRAADTAAALTDLVTAAGKVKAAAQGYVSARNDLTTAMSAISMDLKNVQKQNPLPVDCRPDAGRLRNLQAAAAAANAAAAGTGQQPGGALSANPRAAN